MSAEEIASCQARTNLLVWGNIPLLGKNDVTTHALLRYEWPIRRRYAQALRDETDNTERVAILARLFHHLFGNQEPFSTDDWASLTRRFAKAGRLPELVTVLLDHILHDPTQTNLDRQLQNICGARLKKHPDHVYEPVPGPKPQAAQRLPEDAAFEQLYADLPKKPFKEPFPWHIEPEFRF